MESKKHGFGVPFQFDMYTAHYNGVVVKSLCYVRHRYLVAYKSCRCLVIADVG